MTKNKKPAAHKIKAHLRLARRKNSQAKRTGRKRKKHIIYRTSTALFTSFVLLVAMSFLYFLALISFEYKSFPFITQRIE